MPTYEYECTACKHRFDNFQTMSSDPLTDCPECKESALRRLIGTGSALIFKGSGFYETDYKRKTSDKKGEQLEKKVEKAKEVAKETKAAPSSTSSGTSSGGSGGSES